MVKSKVKYPPGHPPCIVLQSNLDSLGISLHASQPTPLAEGEQKREREKEGTEKGPVAPISQSRHFSMHTQTPPQKPVPLPSFLPSSFMRANLVRPERMARFSVPRPRSMPCQCHAMQFHAFPFIHPSIQFNSFILPSWSPVLPWPALPKTLSGCTTYLE